MMTDAVQGAQQGRMCARGFSLASTLVLIGATHISHVPESG